MLLTFKFCTKQGDTNCLDFMGELQGEGESLSVWGQTMAAFNHIVELCNREAVFQNAKGESLLFLSTVPEGAFQSWASQQIKKAFPAGSWSTDTVPSSKT